MRYRHQMTYDAPAADVYAMLVDPAFQAQRAQAGNPEYAESAVEPGPGDGATVTVTRRMSVDLPGFIKRLTGSTVTLTETQRWPDGAGSDPGGRAAVLTAAMVGQPGGVNGTLRVADAGSGSTVTLDADISVKVPLVGGKIERFVAEMLDKLMRKEHEIGQAWLTAAGAR